MFCFPVLRFVMFSRIYINCSTAIASNDWTSACHWAQHPLPTVLCDKRMNFVASVTSVQMKSWWSITVLVTDYKFSYSNIRPSVGSRYSAVQARVSSKHQCHSCRLLSTNTIRIIYSRVQRTSTEVHGIRQNKSMSRSFSQWSLLIERWERKCFPVSVASKSLHYKKRTIVRSTLMSLKFWRIRNSALVASLWIAMMLTGFHAST